MSESILHTYDKSTIVRTAMVYDLERSLPREQYLQHKELLIQGEIIPHIQVRANQEKRMSLSTNEIISPTSVPTLIEQLTRIISKNVFGIQHCCGASAVSKYEFGELICQVFEIDKQNIKPVNTNNPIRPENVTLEIEQSQEDLGITFPTLQEQLEQLYARRN